MPYAILLNELKPLDFQKTARILAKAENIIYADATRSVRNCCGILAHGLTLPEARSISEELNREGIGVFYMDQAKMYQPEPPFHVNNADCLEESFTVQDLYGRPHPLAWGNIILISLGRVVERKETPSFGVPPIGNVLSRRVVSPLSPMGVTMPPLAPPEPGSRQKVSEEEQFILDIFSEAPQKKHYRIRHHAFNYDYLGNRLKPSAVENFQVLAEDVTRFASEAYGNRGINAYLSGGEPEKLDYSSVGAFDTENFWLLQLIHLSSNSSDEEKPEG